MVLLELEARLDNLLSTAQEETANIDLFAPIVDREECPVCLTPLPLKGNEINLMICCGKMICFGCTYKHMLTDRTKKVEKGSSHSWKDYKCPFCQQKGCVKDDTETHSKRYTKAFKKLMKKSNPSAYMQMAIKYKQGDDGVFQSDTKSLEMRICAAELGHAEAFAHIGNNYFKGVVVNQDESKALEYYEIGAKKGCVQARNLMALYHRENGYIDESINHYRIAASAGHQASMDDLMILYKDELLSKDDLAQTLRACQTSKDLMNSKDREDVRDLIASIN